jgi:Flp pilus assembly protein CpaB
VASSLAPDRSADDVASGAPLGRVLRRRRRLPDSRAVVGALLVAASVVGIYAAYTGPRGASAAYVVAARAVRPGDPLTATDLTRTRVDLPPSLRGHGFTDPSVLVGAIALSPIEAGELIQAGQVIRKRGGAATAELSFPIEASRIGSGLRAGDRVDVVATYGTGIDAYSIMIGRQLHVLSVTRARGTLGGESSAVVLTVALPGRADSLALAHATRAAELSVVRTTGATAGAGEPTTYRPAPGAAPVTP